MTIDKIIEITVILLILFLIIKTNSNSSNLFSSSNNIIPSIKNIIRIFISDSEYIVLEVPHRIKCMLNEPSCEQNNITKGIIIKSLIFMLYGYVFPHNIISAITTSVGIQIINLNMGSGSNLIIDVISNMTGFLIGRTLSPNPQSLVENKYQVISI